MLGEGYHPIISLLPAFSPIDALLVVKKGGYDVRGHKMEKPWLEVLHAIQVKGATE